MAEKYQNNSFKRIIGEGLYDNEIEDLPPRFQKKVKLLENILIERFEECVTDFYSKVNQQISPQCCTDLSSENVCRDKNPRDTSSVEPYQKKFENRAKDLSTIQTTSNHYTNYNTNQSSYSKNNWLRTQNHTSLNHRTPNCYKNDSVNHHLFEQKRNMGTHQNVDFKPQEQVQELAQHKRNQETVKLKNGLMDNFENRKFPHEDEKFKTLTKRSNQESVKQFKVAKSEKYFTQKSFKRDACFKSGSHMHAKNTNKNFVSDAAPCENNELKNVQLHNPNAPVEHTREHLGIEREIKAMLRIKPGSSEINPVLNSDKECFPGLNKNKDSSSSKANDSLSEYQQDLMYDKCVQHGKTAKKTDLEISEAKGKSFHQNIPMKNKCSEKYFDKKNPKKSNYNSEALTNRETCADIASTDEKPFYQNIPKQKDMKYFDKKKSKHIKPDCEFVPDSNLHCISAPRKYNTHISYEENNITVNNCNLPLNLTDSCGDNSKQNSPAQNCSKIIYNNAHCARKENGNMSMQLKSSMPNKKFQEKHDSKADTISKKQYQTNASVSVSTLSCNRNKTLLKTPENFSQTRSENNSNSHYNKKFNDTFSYSVKSSEKNHQMIKEKQYGNRPSSTQNKTLLDMPQHYMSDNNSIMSDNNSKTFKNKKSIGKFSSNVKFSEENHQMDNEEQHRNNTSSTQNNTLLDMSQQYVSYNNSPLKNKKSIGKYSCHVKSSEENYQMSIKTQYRNSAESFPKQNQYKTYSVSSETDAYWDDDLFEVPQKCVQDHSNHKIKPSNKESSSCLISAQLNQENQAELQTSENLIEVSKKCLQTSDHSNHKIKHSNKESSSCLISAQMNQENQAELQTSENLVELSQKCLQTSDNRNHKIKHSNNESSSCLISAQRSRESKAKLQTSENVPKHIVVFSPKEDKNQQQKPMKNMKASSNVFSNIINENRHQVAQNKLEDEDPSATSTTFSVKEQREKQQQNQININLLEVGAFLLKLDVSEKVNNLDYWQDYFKSLFHHDRFKIMNPLRSLLTVFFDTKEEAKNARICLQKKSIKKKSHNAPYVTKISSIKNTKEEPHYIKQNILSDCLVYIEQVSNKCINSHNTKILAKEHQLNEHKTEKSALLEEMHGLRKMKYVFQAHVEAIRKKITNLKNECVKEMSITSCDESVDLINEVKQVKTSLHRECNSFKRCLPVYAEKDEVLKTVKKNRVSIIVAETGSGKSTELVNYLLQAGYANNGLIICTQPRKIAAISISEFVSGQLGSPVGGIVGYDVGTITKSSEQTSILFMTEFSFLRRCVKHPNFKGISCIVVDEAHERTLYTDILLGIIKSCLNDIPKLRVVITSATIDPKVFLDYFGLSSKAVLKILGRIYPVKIVWFENDVSIGWNFVEKCVKTAIKIHRYEGPGDILVFLTSPYETEDAMNLFKNHFNCETSSKAPKLYCLHGKLDTFDQIEIFKPTPNNSRKIIFATNSAETSVTIPGVKYVIDSGMVKEKQYCAQRNKNTLHVTFISKSSAEQRKGRAGRNQPGVCYRMYSKMNFKTMPERTEAEILKTNFQLALLKILEFGFQPDEFDYVEKPSENMISKSWDSLEHLGAVKNKSLTDLGKKIVHLSFEPSISKLIFQGISEKIGYETAIIAALLSISGKVFFRTEENKALADEQKIKFCKKEGDILTFLEVFKQWRKVPEINKSQWCSEHFINFKSMKTALSIVNEIIRVFRNDFSIIIPQRFNDFRFKSSYETILFECYSENLCVFSGHPKSGYVSPYLTESYFIHPSSSLSYIGYEKPLFVLYGNLIETSRNFLLDVTPIKEDTITKAYQNGSFNLPIDMLKYLQVVPKIIGPFGENVLIRYILGFQGSKIQDLEYEVKEICSVSHIEVLVDKGQIVVHTEKRFHDRVVKLIYSKIELALAEMNKEDHIQKINSSCCFSIGSGALIYDIILPGEFRELIFENVRTNYKSCLSLLKGYNDVQTVTEIIYDDRKCISVIFLKAASAEKALFDLKKQNKFKVISKVYLPKQLTSSAIIYRIKVSWCRIPCKGKGWIEFNTPEDCIDASGTLTTRSIYVDDNYIQFAPASHSEMELYMKNLPATAEEGSIKLLLEQHLQSKTIRTVTLVREKIVKVTEGDLSSAKRNLLTLFQKFTPVSKFVIDLKCPSSNDIFWNALVYFENSDDGEKAFTSLQNKAKIGNYALKMEPILRSYICCRSKVYEILIKELHGVIKQYKDLKICSSFDAKPSSTNTDIIVLTFVCKDINGLSRLHQTLGKMVQGYSFCLQSKFNVLRTRDGKVLLDSLEKSLNILVALDSRLSTVCLFGSEKDCLNAKNKILDFAKSTNILKQKVFNLKGVNTPSGFLKMLYKKYGFSLNEFIDKYDLNSAVINIHQRTLTIEGVQDSIEKAEECLETICADISNENSKDKLNGDEEFCEICFDLILSDYQRLEHCGHSFCKMCLLLQLESKIFPVTCVKEKCRKPLFIEDINKILAYGSKEVRELFFSAALQYFVQNNKDSVRYCPRPNCQMIYRIKNATSKITCLGCENEICANCNALYHYGMTCDMFQNSQKDENYSLKVWLKEDQNMRKKCPTCSSAIEKDGGCNHVECISCKTHMCWLCLTAFPSSKDVYSHLPMCPENVFGGLA